MKKFMKVIWILIKWVLFIILFMILGAVIWGEKIPTTYVIIVMFISAALASPNDTKKKGKVTAPAAIKQIHINKKKPVVKYDPNKEFKIPLSQKKREALAQSILNRIQLNIKLANRSEIFGAFIAWYDDIWNDTWKLTLLEKYVKFTGPGPTYEMEKLQNDFQWHLRDAMERHKDRIIRESKSTYRNYPEKTVEECQAFKTSVDRYKDRFDQGTIDFANRMMLELQKSCGVSLSLPEYEEREVVQPMAPVVSYSEDFDNMEGHDFEQFCAKVLRGNGFENVSVTQGSGDQGVDVLAEKNGIKYAIQCKRYTSDLGNAPIQEVFAGKQIYGCHIACVMTNRYFTQGAKDAANATGVILWDRDSLKKMIEISKASTL